MNVKRTLRNLPLVFVLSFSQTAWGGLVLGPQSKLSLEGDSTLHKYSATAMEIKFSADVMPAPGATARTSASEAVSRGWVKNLRVVIPVTQLQSGEKGLDKNMHKALKGDAYPDITFDMESYKVTDSSGTAKISAPGMLSIGGVTKPVTLDAVIQSKDERVIIDGQQAIVMTDFGIKPPKLMFGAIKVDKHVMVKFHLELSMNNPKLNAK